MWQCCRERLFGKTGIRVKAMSARCHQHLLSELQEEKKINCLQYCKIYNLLLTKLISFKNKTNFRKTLTDGWPSAQKNQKILYLWPVHTQKLYEKRCFF